MSETTVEEVHVDERHDWERTVPSVAVAEALASVESVAGGDLVTAPDTTLYDHIEAEALDALVTGEEQVVVEFSVGPCRVRVDGDRLVVGDDGTGRGRT